jgi:thioredoxin 1
MSITNLNSKDFSDFIADECVVVDFYADWCGPCQMLSPILEDVAKQFKQVKFGKINVDQANDIANLYQVRSIPTIFFFKKGKISNFFTGFTPKEKIIEFINTNINT